ncbi:MAG TPA: murein L,D-transpeptidase catalytic domain family protein [Chitinophagaceae bacterium]|nr:murein L,D-transpeptidase catalytic domain family protein [Chitinophagaceae bacterium]
MKNSNLLPLAGFGFFCAVFLSLAPMQQESDRLSEKIAGIPSDLLSEPGFLFAVCNETPLRDSPGSLPPFYKPTTHTPLPIPEKHTVKPRLKDVKTAPTDPKKIISVPVAIAEEQEISSTITAQQNPGPEEPMEDVSSNNSPVPLAYLPEEPGIEEEKILPPTDYVDEVIVPQKQEVTKVLNSAPVPIITVSPEAGLDSYPGYLMQARIEELAGYANDNNYSTEYAFIINLGLKSGKKRFFLVDLLHGTILKSGLVAHGRGKEKFTLQKKYSNLPGSACSSLGLYKIGSAYSGGFGKSFRLIGLEKSNNNALSRAIVLHAMNCIPNEEIDYPICQSEGCPSLSPDFLEDISPVILKSKKPLLLWVFDPTANSSRVPY